METHERPQALQDYFFVAHVGDGVDQSDAVESELDVVALARNHV